MRVEAKRGADVRRYPHPVFRKKRLQMIENKRRDSKKRAKRLQLSDEERVRLAWRVLRDYLSR